MAKGGGNNRLREMDKSDGPASKKKMGNISWDTKAAQPAFLRNAMAALAGPQKSVPLDASGRPSIPQRPEGEEEEESEEDEWDMGRGEEAPSVVILKEGKHLDRDEVDRMRAQAKANSGLDPLASSSAIVKPGKAGTTLNFSTAGSSTKRKLAEGETETTESWEDVIKRSKIEGEAKKVAKDLKEASDKKEKERGEKAKKKMKKVEKKKVGLLSFEDE